MEFSILALLLIIPLIGAIATLCCGGERQKAAKYVAGAFSGVTLVLAAAEQGGDGADQGDDQEQGENREFHLRYLP